ncbi:MAG: LysM peptidoglycan-binding domain-containing protein [Candidatus Omnitrophica bacterium]|nr:LysM peptidoglycan-binding domain-containing protein [Candidatus Omnitrophota bacterium]
MFRPYHMLTLVLIAIFAAGCGVKARTYVMTKDRVGVDYKGGNAGYLKGDPKFKEPVKKTRKVYVLEFSKPVSESEVKKIEEQTTTQIQEVKTEEVPQEQASPAPAVSYNEPPIVIPPIEDAPAHAAAEGPTEAVTYTVQKDDTLQKIAKKFYNSYGKWTRIYEANKDKLKNPNFVKPGTVLTIPAAN